MAKMELENLATFTMRESLHLNTGTTETRILKPTILYGYQILADGLFINKQEKNCNEEYRMAEHATGSQALRVLKLWAARQKSLGRPSNGQTIREIRKNGKVGWQDRTKISRPVGSPDSRPVGNPETKNTLDTVPST